MVSFGSPFGVLFLLFYGYRDWEDLVWESEFKDADPGLVAGGGSSSSAAVGLSRRPDARRQSPGEGGGYQLRPGVGGYGYGYGGWGGRGRG